MREGEREQQAVRGGRGGLKLTHGGRVRSRSNTRRDKQEEKKHTQQSQGCPAGQQREIEGEREREQTVGTTERAERKTKEEREEEEEKDGIKRV